jgi:hypothetical protein
MASLVATYGDPPGFAAKPENEIDLYLSVSRGPYSATDLMRVRLYKDFEAMDYPKYLCTTARWLATWFQVIDADSVSSAMKANEYLILHDYPHVMLESSPGRFWLIADENTTYDMNPERAIWLSSMVPGQDENFIKCCRENKRLVLRAFPKGDFVPKVVAASGDVTPRLDEFCSALTRHFEHVSWYKCVKKEYEKDVPKSSVSVGSGISIMGTAGEPDFKVLDLPTHPDPSVYEMALLEEINRLKRENEHLKSLRGMAE